MHFSPFPFTTTDWSAIEAVYYKGITGTVEWKTVMRDDIRIRLVEYSESYVADHWIKVTSFITLPERWKRN